MTALSKRNPPANAGVRVMVVSLIVIWACHVAGQKLPDGWLQMLTQFTGIAACATCVWGGMMAIQSESDERPAPATSPGTIRGNAIWTD